MRTKFKLILFAYSTSTIAAKVCANSEYDRENSQRGGWHTD